MTTVFVPTVACASQSLSEFFDRGFGVSLAEFIELGSAASCVDRLPDSRTISPGDEPLLPTADSSR